MRTLAAALLLLHGMAHLVGFFGAYRLSAQVPHSTLLFGGRVNVGEPGIRVIGLLWALVAVAFGVAAAGTLLQAAWWLPAALITASISAALCLTTMRETKVGLVLDLLIVFAVGMAFGVDWFPIR